MTTQDLRGLAFPEEPQAEHFSGFNTLNTPFYGRGVQILFNFLLKFWNH